MNHEGIRAHLDDYVDGLLSDHDRQIVSDHVGTCPRCAEEVEVTRSLLRQAAELPAQMNPPGDLWPGVRDRLASPPRRHDDGVGWFRAWGLREGLAMAAVLAVFLAGFFLISNRDRNRPSAGSSPGESTDYARVVWGLEAVSRGAGESFNSTLLAATGGLTTENVHAIEDGLRTLDNAIMESRAALDKDPDNPEHLQRLSDYYQKRLSILQMATRLASEPL